MNTPTPPDPFHPPPPSSGSGAASAPPPEGAAPPPPSGGGTSGGSNKRILAVIGVIVLVAAGVLVGTQITGGDDDDDSAGRGAGPTTTTNGAQTSDDGSSDGETSDGGFSEGDSGAEDPDGTVPGTGLDGAVTTARTVIQAAVDKDCETVVSHAANDIQSEARELCEQAPEDLEILGADVIQDADPVIVTVQFRANGEIGVIPVELEESDGTWLMVRYGQG